MIDYYQLCCCYIVIYNYREIEEDSFEGCINDFYVGALLYDLNQNVESLGGVGGCPATVSVIYCPFFNFTLI